MPLVRSVQFWRRSAAQLKTVPRDRQEHHALSPVTARWRAHMVCARLFTIPIERPLGYNRAQCLRVGIEEDFLAPGLPKKPGQVHDDNQKRLKVYIAQVNQRRSHLLRAPQSEVHNANDRDELLITEEQNLLSNQRVFTA